MLPTVVWMIAVGPAAGVATGVLTGGFAEGVAWPAPSNEVEAIRTNVQISVRIGIPWAVFGKQ